MMTETLKLIYHTAKVRLGFLIMACALAGIAMSPGEELAPWRVLVLGLTVLMASAAAGAFNQLYERDLDSQMKRTKTRAFVTGQLQAKWYWPVALGLVTLVALVIAALVTNIEAAVYIFLGAFTYGIVYTVWLKKHVGNGVLVDGDAGSVQSLLGHFAGQTGRCDIHKAEVIIGAAGDNAKSLGLQVHHLL